MPSLILSGRPFGVLTSLYEDMLFSGPVHDLQQVDTRRRTAPIHSQRPEPAAAETRFERGSLEPYRPSGHSYARNSLLVRRERPEHSDLLGRRGHNDLWQRQTEGTAEAPV